MIVFYALLIAGVWWLVTREETRKPMMLFFWGSHAVATTLARLVSVYGLLVSILWLIGAEEYALGFFLCQNFLLILSGLLFGMEAHWRNSPEDGGGGGGCGPKTPPDNDGGGGDGEFDWWPGFAADLQAYSEAPPARERETTPSG